MPLTPLQLKQNVNAMIDQGATDADIDGYLKEQGTDYNSLNSINEPDFKERMQNDISNRLGNATNAILDMAKAPSTAQGMRTELATVPYIAGQGAGLAFDALGNAIGSIGRSVAPETYKAGQENLGQIMAPVAKGLESAQQTIQNVDPDLAKITSGYGNLLTMGIGGKVTQPASDIIGKGLQKVGESELKTAAKLTAQKTAKIDSFYHDLIVPSINKAGDREVIEKGINRAQIVMPNKRDLGTLETLKSLPGLKESRSLRGNYNIIKANEASIRKNLETSLQKRPSVDLNEYYGVLDAAQNKINNVVGITEKERRILLNEIAGLKQRVFRPEGKISLMDLLQARRDFDKGLSTEVSNKLTKNAKKVYFDGLKDIRDNTNQFIASKAPDLEMLPTLKKQSDLLYVLENLKPKVKAEAKTRLGRVRQSIVEDTPRAWVGKKLGIAAGLTVGLPAAPVAAPIILTNALLKSPSFRKALGITFSKAGTIMRGGKELTMPEVQQLAQEMKLLPAPTKEAVGQPSAEMVKNAQNITDINNSAIITPPPAKMLAAPEKMNPVVDRPIEAPNLTQPDISYGDLTPEQIARAELIKDNTKRQNFLQALQIHAKRTKKRK